MRKQSNQAPKVENVKPAPKRRKSSKKVRASEVFGLDGLTIKQRLFVDHYLICLNGTEAARLAGYEGDTSTLSTVASENLRKPDILNAISIRLERFAMSANEVLVHLTDIARGDIADALNSAGGIDPLEARRRGKSHLIKRFKTKTITSDDQDIYESEVEMYDRLDALKTLAKYHALLIDRVKVDDWRSDVIALLKDRKITAEQVIQELGSGLAEELFASPELSGVIAGKSRKA